MKRSIFLILSLLIVTIVNGQLKLTGSRHDTYVTSSSSWSINDSALYLADAQNRDTNYLLYYPRASSWLLAGRYVFDYDANGKVADYYIQKRDSATGVYHNTGFKFSWTYNAAGDTTSFLYQRWDTSTNSWLNNQRFFRYPDSHHRDTAIITQSWNSVWRGHGYYQYQYDLNGNVTAELYRTWNSATSAYENFQNYTYTYNASNQLTSSVKQDWNISTLAWDNTGKYTYTWNSSGDNTQRRYEIWNTTTSIWNRDSLIYQTFDGSHRVINQISQAYNSGTSTYDILR